MAKVTYGRQAKSRAKAKVKSGKRWGLELARNPRDRNVVAAKIKSTRRAYKATRGNPAIGKNIHGLVTGGRMRSIMAGQLRAKRSTVRRSAAQQAASRANGARNRGR